MRLRPMLQRFSLLFLLSLWGCAPNSDGYFLLEQNQSPYENGYAHGSALKDQVHQQVASWQIHMQQELGLSTDSIFAIINEHTGFTSTIETHAPELLEELRGIADGAGLDRRLVLAYNLGEEIYNFVNRPTERCSNLAVADSSQNLLFYNQDLPPFLHGDNTPVVLKHLDYYVFAMPGTIGISGASRAMAVSLNSLPMLKMNSAGLPLSFTIRKLLELDSITEARDFLHQTPSAIPQNIMLVSADEIVGFEISKNQVTEYTAYPFLYHTNFPIHNTDYKMEGYQAPACARYARIDSVVHDPTQTHTSRTLTQVFDEYPLHNLETYLRFTATYPKDPKQPPTLAFINPKRDQVSISLVLR